MSEALQSVAVRAAVAADLESLVAFNAATARESEGRELDADLLRRGVRAVLGDRARGSYFVAERAGAVVGCLMITLEWSDWRNAWFWWIQSVFVDPTARRGGAYRALHEHVATLARRSADCCGLRLYVDDENHGAQRVYERMGMSRARYQMFEVELAPPKRT